MFKGSSLKNFDNKFDSFEALNSKESKGVSLWLRSEVFNIGPLPIPPNSRLTSSVNRYIYKINVLISSNFVMLLIVCC